MKSAANRFLLWIMLLWAPWVLAQDVQDLYDDARQALLNGNYQKALALVSDARARIQSDPNIDPNGVFNNRLLPKIESAANSMAKIIAALEVLYNSTQAELSFPDLAPDVENVTRYAEQVKKASSQLLVQRDSILTSIDLAPEFNNGLRNHSAFRQIEQLIATGLVDKISEQFTGMFGILTDSIKSINSRYEQLVADLQKLKKSTKASRTENQKLQERLTELSQERLNYMNAISEILMGKAVPENEQLRMVLTEQNIDTVFSNLILSEIQRIEETDLVDSVAFKEMLANYERVKNYNQILTKNNIIADQSTLLDRYTATLSKVQIVQPGRHNYLLFAVIGIVAAIAIFATYKLIASRKKKQADLPPEQTFPPAG